jgi:hypothetical protein
MKRWTALAAAVCVACDVADSVHPSAAVNFVLVAPLCSSILPVEFSVDNRLVGTDTFRVGLAAPRTRSSHFAVVPGQHVLSARVVNGYVWAPHTVSVAAGTVVTDSLPFYCS